MSKIECYLNYQLLGRHIQSARKARNITQEMLAERMNVSLGHIGTSTYTSPQSAVSAGAP